MVGRAGVFLGNDLAGEFMLGLNNRVARLGAEQAREAILGETPVIIRIGVQREGLVGLKKEESARLEGLADFHAGDQGYWTCSNVEHEMIPSKRLVPVAWESWWISARMSTSSPGWKSEPRNSFACGTQSRCIVERFGSLRLVPSSRIAGFLTADRSSMNFSCVFMGRAFPCIIFVTG
jgi:hypothetical protein